jgi:hypothetical protein
MGRDAALVGGLILVFSLATVDAARAQEDDSPPRKSPGLALALSLGITALGTAGVAIEVADGPEIGFPGLVVAYIGPSVGRWYGGGSAAIGLLGRTAGLALVTAAVIKDQEDPEGPLDAEEKRFLYSGLAIWTAATVYDVVMAPLDAREHNRAHELAVGPMLTPGGAGVVLGGSF